MGLGHDFRVLRQVEDVGVIDQLIAPRKHIPGHVRRRQERQMANLRDRLELHGKLEGGGQPFPVPEHLQVQVLAVLVVLNEKIVN